jgi:outer membrane lipoprotein-sorting protein
LRRFIAGVVLLVGAVHLAVAQDILTAERLLAAVGEKYAAVKDFQAKLAVASAKATMKGTIIQRAPNLLRIDFTQPEEQVIAFNGEALTVYLPQYRAVLSQPVATAAGAGGGAGLASAEGLKIMRRNYTVAYTVGPDPMPLDVGSATLTHKLTLTRRSLSEGFTELKLDIDPATMLIRRIVGRTLAEETVSFEFTDIVLNQGIPEARFVYDPPASANLYNNFLYQETD